MKNKGNIEYYKGNVRLIKIRNKVSLNAIPALMMSSQISTHETTLSSDYPFLYDDLDSLDDLSSIPSLVINPAPKNLSVPVVGKKRKKRKSMKKGILDVRNIDSASIVEPLGEGGDQILNFTLDLQKYLNSGDLDKLHETVNQLFEEDCSIQTSAMNAKEYGRAKVFELFLSASRTLPDIYIVLEKGKFNPTHGVITGVYKVTGTKQFGDPHEYLYNQIQFGPSTGVDTDLREKAFAIEGSGGRFQIESNLTMHFVLNPARTKFQNFIMMIKPKNVTLSASSV
jgi:hypothetical protein